MRNESFIFYPSIIEDVARGNMAKIQIWRSEGDRTASKFVVPRKKLKMQLQKGVVFKLQRVSDIVRS